MIALSARLAGSIGLMAVGIWIFAPLVTLSMPLYLVAQISLRQQLRRHRLRRFIPSACIADIAGSISKCHAEMARALNWAPLLLKDHVREALLADVEFIRHWLEGCAIESPRMDLPEVLAKHRICFGILSGEGRSRSAC